MYTASPFCAVKASVALTEVQGVDIGKMSPSRVVRVGPSITPVSILS